LEHGLVSCASVQLTSLEEIKMTDYNNVILGNCDTHILTPSGGSHKAKFNMMITSDDPQDLQVYSLEEFDEVFTSESGRQVRIVMRPAVVRPSVAITAEQNTALLARVAELEANKPASTNGANGSATDVPF